MAEPVRVGVLISGRGSNLQALIDAIGSRQLDASIAVVISNREDAQGLERARRAAGARPGPGNFPAPPIVLPDRSLPSCGAVG